jgi:hypothetical protein
MTITVPNLMGLALGGTLTVILLVAGHYGLKENLSRIQSYAYGVASLMIGLLAWAWGADHLAAFWALGILAAAGGATTALMYWLDKNYGLKKFPNTTPDRERVHILEKELAQRDLELAQVMAEAERLRGMPAAVAEYQRQEIVAAASATLEILAELTEKAGVIYGNILALKAVFMNRGALNMSLRSQRVVAAAMEAEKK